MKTHEIAFYIFKGNTSFKVLLKIVVRHVLLNVSLIFFQYGRQKAFKTVKDFEGFDSRSAYMFHIRGEDPDETRAIQVRKHNTSFECLTSPCFVVFVAGGRSLCVTQYK